MKRIRSVAGPDPESSDSLTPGSGIRDGKKSGSWISDGCKLPVPKFNVADPEPVSVWSWIRESGSAINILDPQHYGSALLQLVGEFWVVDRVVCRLQTGLVSNPMCLTFVIVDADMSMTYNFMYRRPTLCTVPYTLLLIS